MLIPVRQQNTKRKTTEGGLNGGKEKCQRTREG